MLKIDCPPSHFKIVKSYHTNTKATVKYDGNLSDSFTIKSGVMQGYAIAPTLFGIFVSMLSKRAFCSSTSKVKMHTRSDGRLFTPVRLKTKRMVKKSTVRDLLFADDAALVAHSAQDLRILLSQFSSACSDSGLTISLKKTKVLNQRTDIPPTIKRDDK